MTRAWPLAFAVLSAAALSAAQSAPVSMATVAGGTRVEVAFGNLTEGAETTVRIRLSDASTGTPLTSAAIGAWLTPHAPDSSTSKGCRARVATFIGGGVFAAPEIEINASYVLGLNTDGTITALSPARSFGGTRMAGLIQLPAQGTDWVLSNDTRRLFVAMPAAHAVAVVDTFSWTIAATIDGLPGAGSVSMQPDGGYVWVSTSQGIGIIETRSLKLARSFALGAAAGAAAFSDDSRTAFIAIPARHEVAIFSTGALDDPRRVDVGAAPGALAYSPHARAAWVATGAGEAVGVSTSGAIEGRVAIGTGPHIIGFARGMRHAIVINRGQRSLQVIDTAARRVTKQAPLNGSPEHIVFSDRMAYLSSPKDDTITLVALEAVASDGGALSTTEIPSGGGPSSDRGAITAASIASGASLGALAIASAPDRAVHIYREGMAAPVGALRNDRRVPGAVLVVDRGLRETREPGLYESTVRLPSSGTHDLVLYTQTPALAHCFAIDVAPSSQPSAPGSALAVSHGPLSGEPRAREKITVRFRLTSRGAPITGRDDVTMVVMLAPGRWHARVAARAEADGMYAADVTPPAGGTYYVYAGSAGLGLSHANPHYQVIEIHDR